MEIDQAIIQLGINLDEWFDKNRATFESQDRVAQGTALLRGFDLAKKLEQIPVMSEHSLRDAGSCCIVVA